MAKIGKTRITTGDPVSVFSGLPIWPSLGAIKLGMSADGSTIDGKKDNGSLINSRHKILAYRFSADLYYDFLAGIGGPGFAVGMDLEGETSDNTLTLTVSDDELQAGMGAGLNFGAGVEIQLEHYKLFKGWKTDLDLKAGVDFDILGLFITAIKWAMQSGGGKGAAEMKPLPNAKGYYGMLGSSGGNFGYTDTAVAEPKVHIPIDIVPKCPSLEAINESLHALLGELGMGPTIWFGIPVTVGISSISIDGAKYTGIKASGKGKLTGTTTDTPPATPSKMQVELSHNAEYDFGVGVYAEVSVLKIFSLSGNIDISLLKLFGIETHFGTTYHNTLEKTIGGETVAAVQTGNREPAHFRVVLNPIAA